MKAVIKILRFLTLASLLLPAIVYAENAHVAVAANFAAPMKEITRAFEKESGHQLTVSIGSTGKLFSQIKNGAPFDVFLAADMQTPKAAQDAGLGVPGSGFTYAIGKLALWSPNATLVDGKGNILRTGSFERIAMANPKLAPYGAAAKQVVEKMSSVHALRNKWVFGQSIGQTYQFIASGNVPLGFVSLSQIMKHGKVKSGSAWIIPDSMYDPLLQNAQLLEHGRDNEAAIAFIKFLKSPAAAVIIEAFGYALLKP